MSRTPSRMFHRVVLVGFVAGSLALGGSSFAQDGKCKVATTGDSPVAKACKDGGIKAAKATMKDMVKKAKAAGVKMDCDDCHKDDTSYELTADGKDKFKKMMAAVEKK
jgi:hypothetical protein